MSFTRRFLAACTLGLLIGGAAASDAQAQTRIPVFKGNRELVICIELAPEKDGFMKSFYEFVEFGAEGLATMFLGGKYNRIHIVKGSAATLNGFVSRLDYVSRRSNVLALDCIFVTHGLSSRIAFDDGQYSITNVRDTIRARIPSSRRQKFRMMFSTACYGSSHRSGWRGAGFKAVSGGRRIYADSAASYPAFLISWAGGSSFATSVDRANNADVLRINDNIAKGFLQLAGYTNWWDVNSFRDRSGFTSLTVGTQILGLF